VNGKQLSYRILSLALRATLVISLVGAGWIIYNRLPNNGPTISANNLGQTTVEIVLRPELESVARDIPIEISPVDRVAVRHEFYMEPRPGQRLDDFERERMKGRKPIETKLDKEGRASLTVAPGEWWLHAVLAGDEDLEWRLPITISGNKQTIELTPQNAYTRSKSF
jgi:hypothetical protein